jgi:hypothetical protein
VSWDEFCSALEKIKAEMGTKAGNAREYTSYEKMKADRFKHVRVKLDL